MRQALWLIFGIAASALFVGGASGTVFFLYGQRQMMRHRQNVTPVVYVPSANPTEPWQGGTPEDREPEDPDPKPEVKRVVPSYDATLLAGCSQKDLRTIEARLHDAIGLAAPLYNAGDVSGSYFAYDKAAHSIALTMDKTCKGPAKALEESRARASQRATLPEQAWAMRDTFDGLLDVIQRRGTEL